MNIMEKQRDIKEFEPRERIKYLASMEREQLFDNTVPIHRYFRSGNEMLRMAKMYDKQLQPEKAFILYARYITLFVEKVPKHPGYHTIPASMKANTKEKLKEVFPVAEGIKNSLLYIYEKEYDLEMKKKREQEEKDKLDPPPEPEKTLFFTAIGSDYKGKHKKTMILSQDDDCVDFAAKRMIEYHNDDRIKDSKGREYDDIGRYIERFTDLENQVAPQFLRKGPPIIQKSVPIVDRSTKPLLSPGPETGRKHGMREVYVPSELIEIFLLLAESNTKKNIETCGILAGELTGDTFPVSHLILPKQSGTSDSCTTDNEEEIFMYQDKHNLLTIGWIHTHPTQTAFLSSVDLHTQCSYQLFLPEAIAIVCCPKYKETQLFSLTPEGLKHVAACRKPDFHLHTLDAPLFEKSPHAVIVPFHEVIVEDLRS